MNRDDLSSVGDDLYKVRESEGEGDRDRLGAIMYQRVPCITAEEVG